MHRTDFLLQDLNEEQQQAVTHGEGPLLIVAGAGTGKTSVIARRIAWLILSEKCKPHEVLALTFTDKAAGEMEERIDKLLPYGYVHLWVSTFHAFCDRILRQHAFDIGLSNEYTLLDQTSLWLLMKKNLDRFQFDYYRPLGNPTKFIHALIKHFSRAKDEEITPDTYIQYAQRLLLNKDHSDELSESGLDVRKIQELANGYQAYEQLLFEHNALDFGSLIMYTLKLFRERGGILEKYRTQFKYILVDEFQDTNWAQYELIKLLAFPKNNLTVVGDDDQSIYKFRGASVANVLEFKKDFPNSTSLVLIQNYRSSQKILDHAYQFIQQNNPNRLEYREQLPKKLISAKNFSASEVSLLTCQTQEEEALKISQSILHLKEKYPEMTWADIAILVRSNDAAHAFLESLEEHSIPYVFLAQRGLYAKPIILDVLAYARLLINPYDSPALYRVLRMAHITFSLQALQELNYAAQKGALSLWEMAQKAATLKSICEQDQKELLRITSLITNHASKTHSAKPVEMMLMILHDTGILRAIKDEQSERNRESLRYLLQFFGKVKSFQQDNPECQLIHFLEHISLEQEAGDEGTLSPDIESGPDTVKVMTVHASKGLEFEAVFLSNLVDLRFPTIQRNDSLELPLDLIKETILEGDYHLEEERRLFYVGMTRAKRFLTFSWCRTIGTGGRTRKPSRFLYELNILPKEFEKDSIRKTRDITSTQIHKSNEYNKDGQFVLPRKLSYSQLKAFQTCPLQYKFAFLIKIPTFGKPIFSFGKTMHATLQKFFEAGKERQNEVSFDELLKIYDTTWIDEWYHSKNQKNEYYQKGKRMLKSFYDDIVRNPMVPKYLEQDFTLKVLSENQELIVLKGRIDRIDTLNEGGIEIIDYKTGTPKTAEKLTADDKEQLLLYQLAAQEVLHEQVKQLTYYYLEDGSRVSFLGSEKDQEKVKKMVVKTAEEMNTSNFEATPGWHCRFCDFKDICEFRKL